MSTYLVALAVGDFECIAGTADGIPVRICSTPDKKSLTGFALEVDAAHRRVLQPLLLHQISLQEARHRRRARLRRRRDGEHRRDLLSRDAAARRAGRVGRRAQGHRRSARARDRAPVVRRSRDDAVVGRHLAERGLRQLDDEQAAQGVAARLEGGARRGRATTTSRWASTRCARRGRSARRRRRRRRSASCSIRSPTRRAPPSCACSRPGSATQDFPEGRQRLHREVQVRQRPRRGLLGHADDGDRQAGRPGDGEVRRSARAAAGVGRRRRARGGSSRAVLSQERYFRDPAPAGAAAPAVADSGLPAVVVGRQPLRGAAREAAGDRRSTAVRPG